MFGINFPIYLFCIVFLINGLSTLPTEETLSTTAEISTVIQYPINSNLTKDTISNHNRNQQSYKQYKHEQNHHHHSHQQQQNLGYLIGNCLTKPNISNCITTLAIDTIEIAIKDNNTWNINPYISMVPNSDWHPKLQYNKHEIIKKTINTEQNNSISATDNDLNDILINKIKDFAESKSIRVSLVPKKINEAESRSKKGGKDKGGAMVGVMVMIGVMAQMFMGKVLMLAGGAFLISKLALLFSILSGLKKSGGSSDHVIYTEASGGGGHGGGWNRQLDLPPYHGDIIQKKNFI